MQEQKTVLIVVDYLTSISQIETSCHSRRVLSLIGASAETSGQ